MNAILRRVTPRLLSLVVALSLMPSAASAQVPLTRWVRVEAGTTSNLLAVFEDASSVFAVGANGTLIRFDGARWTPLATPTTLSLNAVWAASVDNAFLVGMGGSIFHYDGRNVVRLAAGSSASLRGVWGRAPDDVTAVGDNGTILAFDGAEWKRMFSGTSSRLRGIHGAEGRLFAVGDNGTILSREKAGWVRMETPTTRNLFAVWVRNANDAFAVGHFGTVLRYNGRGWRVMETPTTQGLTGVWALPTDRVFAVGDNGTVLEFDGVGWSRVDTGTGIALNGVYRRFAVGNFGTVLVAVPATRPSATATASANDVSLTWQVPDGDTAAGFNVYRRVDGGPEALLAGPLPADTRRYDESGLAAGHTYSYVVGALQPDGGVVRSTPSEVHIDAAPATRNEAPRLDVSRVFPNPFTTSARVEMVMPESGRVRVAVYDVSGKQVAILVDSVQPAGHRAFSWDGRDGRGHRVSAGTYFLKIEAAQQSEVRKVVLVR